MTIGQKAKNDLTLKNVKKMPKKLNIFSLKIHKGAGIFKKVPKLYGRSKLKK